MENNHTLLPKISMGSEQFVLSSISGLVSSSTVSVGGLEELGAVICANNWCPADFVGGRRNLHNFSSTNLLVLDVDEGISIDAAARYFENLNLQFLIGATKSHQIEKVTASGMKKAACDRFRVVLPLARPILNADEYYSTWFSVAEDFGFADPACKDPSHLYYPCINVACLNESGTRLEPVNECRKVEVTPPLTMLTSGEIRSLRNKRILSKATREFLLEGAEPGTWNHRLFKAAKDMQEQGYSKDEVIAKLGMMSNQYFSGNLDSADLTTISSAFSQEPKYLARACFPEIRERKDKWEPEPLHPNNMKYMIQEIMGLEIGFNEMKRRVFCKAGPIDDFIISEIRNSARAYRISDSKDFTMDTIRGLAIKNSYNPFKQYVELHPWDGTDHIAALFSTVTVSGDFKEETEHFKKVFKRFFIGLIARVYEPGSQNLTLVFKGEQGTSKSRWIKRLAPVEGMFAEGALDPDSKDDRARHLNYVLHHASELDSISKRKDVAAFKSFLTLDDVSVRLPYDMFPSDGRSRLSFIASVNSEDFLRDTTGNRRFLVIPIDQLNAEHSVDVQQVYAQALVLFNNGEQYWFDREEIAFINEFNEGFMPVSYAKELVSKLEIGSESEWFSLAQIIQSSSSNFRVNENEIRRLLKAAKFESKVIKRNGVKLTYYNVRLPSIF